MPDPATRERVVVDAKRIKRFAAFFKSYMSVSAVVVAALPIPITAWKVVPIYESQKGSLATFTPLACFLVLSYVFYMRHTIGAALFVHRHARPLTRVFLEVMPLLLIIACFACMFAYHTNINSSIQALKPEFSQEATRLFEEPGAAIDYTMFNVLPDGKTTFSGKWFMQNVALDKVPDGTRLMLLYIGMFVAAEAAFVLMALREYIQDVQGVTDPEVMTRIMAEPRAGRKN